MILKNAVHCATQMAEHRRVYALKTKIQRTVQLYIWEELVAILPS